MPEPDPDALLERALEIALSRPEGWRQVVPDLAAENPEATMLDLAATVARAALAVEEASTSEERDGLAARLHRVAALTALDAWCAARHGWGEAKAGQLDLYRRMHGKACEEG